MIPAITIYARKAFSYLTPEARAEAVAEVLANACQAFARLVQLRKTDLAYASVLARYGVQQTRDHRKVGNRLNIRDVQSSYCQARKGIRVERLDKYVPHEDAWEEVVVEDRTAGPADVVRTKLDFSDWLASLNNRQRRVALYLANGETTKDAAERFKLSAGRISQLRRELSENWKRFVGDEPGPAAAA
jgi:DNA-directed RNA polymerase specialized sigma subunit